MKLFFKRLFSSIFTEILGWIIAFIIAIPILIITSIVVIATIGIPMILLDKLIGEYSMIWAFLVFLSVIIYINKSKIKRWIEWQFIEPFNKR